MLRMVLHVNSNDRLKTIISGGKTPFLIKHTLKHRNQEI